MASFIPYSVAMVTPFTKEGKLDTESVPAVVKYLLDQGIPGLLISGSTGEQHCLTIEERQQLYSLVGKTVEAGYPLYAGVATFKTEDAKALARAAKEAGFSGIMLGFPPYRTPTQKEAEFYVKEVAESVQGLPIFLYNNPGPNGFTLEAETFVRIAKSVDNVLGMKEIGNPERVKTIKSELKNDTAVAAVESYSFFTGLDSCFIDWFTTYGYTGITSVAGNVYHREMQSIVEHLLKGEVDQAKEIMKTIAPGIEVIEKAGQVKSIKYLLRQKNVPVGYCPAPIMDVDDETKQALDRLFLSQN